MVINDFMARLVQYPKAEMMETVVDPPFLLQRTTEVGPTFLVSA